MTTLHPVSVGRRPALSRPPVSTPAILIRRTEYGDADLIVTFFALTLGKVSLIAKSAKKSTRRFAGVLELFTEMDIVADPGRRGGLAVLQEVALRSPRPAIRRAPHRTAYASYWAELVNDWMEEGAENAEVFHLLRHVLDGLDAGTPSAAALSILFQMRLLKISGHCPHLGNCVICRCRIEEILTELLTVEIARGGVACPGCLPADAGGQRLSKGTAKQLLWVAGGDLARACRMKFTLQSLREGEAFLEHFVPYHLGRLPRSLRVLRQLRGDEG
jgi:DNA repair protein RecO (recombination protein O)